MSLFDTPLEPERLQRNSDDFAVARRITKSGNDHPIPMLNMSCYTQDAGFPNREVHHEYITGRGPFLEGAGATLLWRFPVFGQAVGNQKIDEIITCWYPLERDFLDLYEAPGAAGAPLLPASLTQLQDASR